MNKINCIIVEDEPIARLIIKEYASHLPYLNILEEFEEVKTARLYLFKHSADLIFLDINLPGMSGLEFIRTLQPQPLFILTTAYKEHALAGFELNAVDYLLKPFSFERFTQAINKATERLAKKEEERNEPQRIFVKSDFKQIRILLDTLLFCEAKGNYTRMVTTENEILTAQSLSKIEEQLPKTFLRVHRSFIINKAKVESVEGNLVHIGTCQIPVGQHYKSIFEKEMGLDS